MLYLERGSVEGRFDFQGEVHQRSILKGKGQLRLLQRLSKHKQRSSRGEPRFRYYLTTTYSRRTSDEARKGRVQSKIHAAPEASDTALKAGEARRESAGSIHRYRGNTKDRCRQVLCQAISVDDG